MNLFTQIITYTVFLPMTLFMPDTSGINVGGYCYDNPNNSEFCGGYIQYGQWVKIDPQWESIEPQNGVYNWSRLDWIVKSIRDKNGKIFLTVHNTPTWARSQPYRCKLPDELYFLKRFIQMIVDRYKPEAIGFWNEPEMDAETATSLQSCCGCLNPHEYRSALNYIYDSVDFGNTKLIAGELLGDKKWIDQLFSGEIKADGISFHHYNYGLDTNPLSLTLMKGYLQGKTKLPIWLTETNLLCDKCGEPFRYYQSLWLENAYNLKFEVVLVYSQNQVWWKQCNSVDERKGIVYPLYYKIIELTKPNSK